MIEPGQLWEERDDGLWGLLVLEEIAPMEGERAWCVLVLWDSAEPVTVGSAEMSRESFLLADHRRVL